jgi:hypothetical protein
MTLLRRNFRVSMKVKIILADKIKNYFRIVLFSPILGMLTEPLVESCHQFSNSQDFQRLWLGSNGDDNSGSGSGQSRRGSCS